MNGTILHNDSTVAAIETGENIAHSSATPPSKRYSVGYIFDTQMMLHHAIHGHHEEPRRIDEINKILVEHDCVPQMKRILCREAKRHEVLLVHSVDFWDKVHALSCEHYLTNHSLSQSDQVLSPDNARDRTI
jgi:acetoin utilization deacetylase AcuC-like enzyme